MEWDLLTDEQRELRDLVRPVTREHVAPRAAEIDASHAFPWDVVEAFRSHGLFGLFFGEEEGGTGTGALLSRFLRDAKITQIYEGTQEIQRLVIAPEMLKENRTFLLEGVA